MVVLKGVLCGIVFFLIPLIIGVQFLKKEEKENLILAFIVGNVISFAVFQIIAIPMIFAHLKLTQLIYLWTAIIGVLTIFSLIKNVKIYKEILNININKIKKMPKTSIIAILLIGLQLFVAFRYMYVNEDDARFVGMSTTAIQTNTLMDYDALTGDSNYVPQLRRALASFPIYVAVISVLTNFPPAILAHTILPVILILLAYAIYLQIASKVLKLKDEEIAIFLSILSIVNIFGNYSTRTNFSYFLLRIWQGKAIIAAIVIPLIWLIFFKAKEEKEVRNWILLSFIMFFACMVSTIGVLLAPMCLLILAFVFTIKEKKFSYLVKSLLCSIPCIAYAVIYFLF